MNQRFSRAILRRVILDDSGPSEAWSFPRVTDAIAECFVCESGRIGSKRAFAALAMKVSFGPRLTDVSCQTSAEDVPRSLFYYFSIRA